LQHGHGITQRFTGSRGRGNDGIFAIQGGFYGGGLMGEELMDVAGLEGGEDTAVNRCVHRLELGRAGGEALPGDDLGDEVTVEAELGQEVGQGHGGEGDQKWPFLPKENGRPFTRLL
jgi:hypothetical protein